MSGCNYLKAIITYLLLPADGKNPHLREQGELKYLLHKATLEIRILVSSINHVILTELIIDQFKHWGLNAQ